jgi:hypothetical protein
LVLRLRVLLLFGIAPIASALTLWVLYLSLTSRGRRFCSSSGIALLLEAGLTRDSLRAAGVVVALWHDIAPPPLSRWVLWGLAFKVTFLSGITKILSGDPTWANLTALQYHYETQPLPMWTGWFMHQLRSRAGLLAAGMFVIELVRSVDGVPACAMETRQADRMRADDRAAAGNRGDGQLRLLQPADDRAVSRRPRQLPVTGRVGRSAEHATRQWARVRDAPVRRGGTSSPTAPPS